MYLNLKTEFLGGIGRKHCGKSRKCWLPAFSPFPTFFSKGFFLRVVKSPDCVVKSYPIAVIMGSVDKQEDHDGFI